MGGWLDRLTKPVTSEVGHVLGAGVDTVHGAVNAVGAVASGVADLAEAPFTNDEYDGFLGTIYDVATKRGAQVMGDLAGPNKGLGAAIGAVPEVVRDPAGNVLHSVTSGSERLYHDAVARPISALMIAGSLADAQSSDPGNLSWGSAAGLANFFHKQTWRDAWGKSGQDADPGHAIAMAIGTKDITDPEEVARFAATDHYRQWSGIADALLRYRFDPLVVASGAASEFAQGAHAVPLTQEGIVAARDSTRVARFVDRVDNIVTDHGDGAAARIRHEMFPTHPDGAYISDLLANAPDTVTRRQVVGSLMGSADDFEELTRRAPAVANQITNLTSDTLDALQQEKGLLGPGRVQMLDQQLQDLYPELDQAAKLRATYASLQEIPGASVTAQARAAITASDFYQKSPLATPVRVVTNMLPQHWVNLNDERGDIQVARMLQQSGLDGDTQAALRSTYMGQVGAAARQRSLLDIEAQVTQAVLDKYNVPKWVVDDVIQNANRLRGESVGAMARRTYDAAGRGELTIPQADGSIARMALPLHVTQQADLLPLVDVKSLERAAQAVQGWDWSAEGIRNGYQNLRLGASGSTAARTAAAVTDFPAELLEGFYSLWRPATLLRVGWPLRILGDEQLRILSKVGALTHFGKLAEATADNVRQRLTPWEMTLADGETIAGRGLPKLADATPEQISQGIVRKGIGDYESSLKLRSGESVTLPPAFGAPGDAEDVYRRLNSSSSAFREIAVPEETGLLKQFRQHTGSWVSIDPRAEGYPGVWANTVNRQLKQSAFAQEFLKGATVDDGVRWLAKTDAGVAYAREMGWRPATFEQHAADVADQVNRYVPTEGLRQKLLDQPLTHADLAKAVPDQLARPAVHGEELAQALGTSGISRMVTNIRDNAFKYLGQVPTDVLSRNPFFDSMYQMEAERQLNILDDAARQSGRVLTPEDVGQAAGSARRFALNESQKLLYDLAEKSQFASMLRFVAPFYMAWQEVLTRWAGIAVDNPAYVARLRQVWDAPEKAGLVSDEHGAVIDGDGNATDPLTGAKRTAGTERYITLPFGIPGLPTHGAVKFNKKSANLALSGTPGFGPPVQIAVNEIVKNKPDLEQSVKFILPYGATQSTLQLLLPSAAKRAYTAAQGEDDRQYVNTMNRILGDRMTDFMLGKRPDKPTYAEVKKATDSLYHIRTIASWVLPVSPIFDSPYQPYINAYRNAQERLRSDPNAFGKHPDGSPKGPDEWFLDTYGDEYFWLTQALSKSNEGVAPTAEGYDARKKYQDLIEKHPELGSVIIGNEGAGQYSSGVYQSQLAHDTHPGSGVKQREPLTFDEYEQAPEVRLGWIKYGQAMDVIEAERVKRGLPNLQVSAAADLALIKQVVTKGLEAKYQAWANDFNQQDTAKWPKRITALREIASDPRLAGRADRPDIAGLKMYLQARDVVVATLKQRPAKTLTAAANQDIAQIWDTVRASIVERFVAFQPLYLRYLERDPLEGGS